MLRSFLKIALRQLWKNRVYTFVSMLGLAVSLASFMIILLYFNYELSYDTWHQQLKRVQRISIISPENGLAGTLTPAPLAPMLQQSDAGITAYTRVQLYQEESLITANDKRMYQHGIAFVDSGFLRVFPYTLVAGNAATALLNPASVVISEDLRDKLFGHKDPIGKTLMLNNYLNCIVTGVMRLPATPSHLNMEAIVSNPWMKENTSWNNFSFTTYLLTDAETDNILDEKITSIYQTQAGNAADNRSSLGKLITDRTSDIHNFPKQGESNFKTALTLLVLSVLLLISGIINFINLSLARSFNRLKEVGIRKALGSDRKQLISQFLFEIALQCTISLLLAMGLIYVLLPVFNQTYDLSLSFWKAGQSYQFLFQLLLAFLLTIFLTGFYPAFLFSKQEAVKVLKGSLSENPKGIRFSNSLIVVQHLVSVFFIVCVIVMSMQLHYMTSKDIGLNPSQVISLKATQKTREKDFDHVRTLLLRIPGVEYVSKSTAVPGSAEVDTSSWMLKYGGKIHPMTSVRVSTDYFKTLNIRLREGRLFDEAHPEDKESTVILNEAAAQQLGGKDLVGSLLRFPDCDDLPYKIIGVVNNFHVQGFENTVKPAVYSISNSRCGFQAGGTLLLKIEAGKMKPALDALVQTWSSIEPDFPIRYSFLDDNFRLLFANHLRTRSIVVAFTILSILIAMMSMFALTAYLSELRIREIGIRKVLGASTVNLVGLLGKDFLKLSLMAVIIALPLSWYIMDQWLENFAYRIKIQWWMFLAAALLSIVITLLTVCFHGIKAATMNPVKSLRVK